MVKNNKDTAMVVIYEDASGNFELRADFDNDTLWATLDQIAMLFERDKSVISRHLRNIYKEGELSMNLTVAKNATVQIEGDRKVQRDIEYYNLDAILSVGYRVSSRKATQFRIWATNTLREYLKAGYKLNEYAINNRPEALEGLHEALDLIESNKFQGKLKGKLTFKLTKDLVNAKSTE